MSSATASPRRSLLLTIGLLMGLILALGLAAMIGAMLVAQVNQGMASAVNQSGTLRMQSYRIAAVLADLTLPARERAERARQLADELGQRLASPRLTEALPNAATDPLRIAYEQVAERWHQRMRPALKAEAIASGGRVYRAQVDAFVEQIHTLVRILEDRAEQRIDGLAWMQAGALGLTLLTVLVTLLLVQRRLVRPLDALLQCADQVRQGDFSARTGFVGEDELGRLGAAMNLMTRGLWNIYNELEERVAEKTRDLARSNHSLQLLYRTSRALDGAMISDQTLRAVLRDLEHELKLAAVTLCLRDRCSVTGAPTGNALGGQLMGIAAGDAIGDQVGQTVGNLIRDAMGAAGSDASGDSVGDPGLCIGTRQPLDAEGSPISADPPGSPCALCAAASTAQNCSIIAVAVADQYRRYGTLRVVCRDGVPLESWQQPLLEALAAQLATALNLQGRIRESRRLVLHEERSILARELHDSLAQSLSYLKIQSMRLDGAIKAPAANGQPSPEAILGELREGINSAYRQLRELLTTFRLKIDGQGLRAALAQTIDEFRVRGDLIIRLDDQLPPGLLSPNEEVHVLQIVREALSNATRHARARTLKVRLDVDA
ncbi:MAG: type IV pili methyl-accepting chemotaxis transducer N-terminal domain-containing protein, partial [Chromatiaceae bacterium]|nr:type IV pili methyl-accepting chemotaxis transducer N-terminal domain-containing protein [Chromatiaceae bacterium]